MSEWVKWGHMRDTGRLIGGESVHVRDCYVWAEIDYLDSATDYREFLSAHRPIVDSELTMLDSSGNQDALGMRTLVFVLLIVAAGIIGWLYV